MLTALLLLNIGKDLRKGRLYATVVVSYNDVNLTRVACQLKTYFLK